MRQFKLTVTSKGQVTLPAEYRKAAGISSGSTLSLVVDETGEARLRRRLTLDDLAGSLTAGLTKSQRNFTQADIDAAVDQAMTEKAARGARKDR